MASLTFLGATGTVTGSRFLLHTGEKKILIDCGLFQGPKKNRLRNWDPFPEAPGDIDAVALTHAHIDHIGYLPRICRDGFKGRVYCTHATADLAKILLRDTAHLQEEDAHWANRKRVTKHDPALPLFTTEDAEACLSQFSPVHYGEEVRLDDGLRLKFRDAGHILGSSLVDIKRTNDGISRKILFCGDLGRPARAILRDPVQVYNIDYLLLESTYGNRLHEEESIHEELAAVIMRSLERDGVLVIPSFSVGRTQTLLYILRELEEQKKIPILPVYMDSPMALEATAVYERRIPSQNLTCRTETVRGKKIFHPQNLHLCESKRKSKAINDIKERAIIISASGMVTGGRILHHMQMRLPRANNTILFIGYQAEGTRGRAILEKRDTVKIFGEEVPIRAHIENIPGMSCHADYNEILAWLMGFDRPPKKIFIVHGEPEASNALAERIHKKYNWPVTVPEHGEKVLLDF